MSDLVLVTGGAGFIGSSIVEALVESGHSVRVLDHASPTDGSGVEFIRGDIRNRETVERALAGVGAVCHQAAMVGLGVDFTDVCDYVSHNDLGTAMLLRALAERSFAGRLVLASSMVVYGEGRYRCASHGVVRPGPRDVDMLAAGVYDPPCPSCGGPLSPEAIPEDAPIDPRNVYAATKAHQEHLAFSFSREHGVPVTALRYHNVYGRRMPRDTPYAGVAAIFRSALEAGSRPHVFEDGNQMRDFIHVRDVARANLLALTAPEPVPGAFNVASGTPHTVLDMASALAAAFGPEAPRPVVTGRYRLGDVRHVFASPARASEALGYTAEITFEAGMAEFATVPLGT